MFLWEVSWAPSSLDFDENTWHCHIHPASWSNKRVTLVVLLINAQPCSYWVNIATGANYPAMELIGPILPEVDTFPEKYLKIREMSMLWILSLSLFQSLTHSFQIIEKHFQFLPEIQKRADAIVSDVVNRSLMLVNVKSNLSWAVSSLLWLEPQQLQFAYCRVVKLKIWYEI